jgi:integrase
MALVRKISKSAVNKLKPGESITDSNPVGFVARKLPSGAVTYGFRYRDKRSGKQPWIGLGVDIAPEQARKQALKIAAEVRSGGDPAKEGRSAAVQARKKRQSVGYTLDDLLDDFVKRHVRPHLRSAGEIERAFRVYVRPGLGHRLVYDLRRLDIVELLDRIEDDNGPVMADRVLAHLRKAFRWYATRDDTFVPPVVPGMARTKPKDRARNRVLDDQEIRDVWRALDELGVDAPRCYPPLVKTILLTSARREEASGMHTDEITGADWLIPGERYKTKLPHLVPLTDAVLGLLELGGKKGFVFSSDKGKTQFSGWSKSKKALDAKIAEIRKREDRPPMPKWVHHDLRRSARTLMSRAKVPADHAERAMGHVMGDVRRAYDVWEYRDEKRAAFEQLAALVQRILHPDSKVISLPKRG